MYFKKWGIEENIIWCYNFIYVAFSLFKKTNNLNSMVLCFQYLCLSNRVILRLLIYLNLHELLTLYCCSTIIHCLAMIHTIYKLRNRNFEHECDKRRQNSFRFWFASKLRILKKSLWSYIWLVSSLDAFFRHFWKSWDFYTFLRLQFVAQKWSPGVQKVCSHQVFILYFNYFKIGEKSV